MTETTDPQQAARDRLFALIASIPGSGGVDWCGKARALLNEIAAAPAAAPSAPADRAALPSSFVLWLDASDGSVPTHDGIVWPDGTATVHHRHFGYTITRSDPEAARQSAHGEQGRLVWPETAPADRAALRDRIAAAIAEQFTPDGKTTQGMRVSFQGPDGWPASRQPNPGEVADAVLAVLNGEEASRD